MISFHLQSFSLKIKFREKRAWKVQETKFYRNKNIFANTNFKFKNVKKKYFLHLYCVVKYKQRPIWKTLSQDTKYLKVNKSKPTKSIIYTFY